MRGAHYHRGHHPFGRGGRYGGGMMRRFPYFPGPPMMFDYGMANQGMPMGMGNGFDPSSSFKKGNDGGGFQRVYPVDEKADKFLNEALLQRNQDTTPTPSDQAFVSALMSKIQSQLDALVLNPSSFEPCQIEEVKQVGSYKTQTMIRDKNQTDIVIVFRTLPTKEAVNALCNKVLNDYRIANRSEWVQSCITDAGFDIATRQASLRCLVATIPMNLRLLDDAIHVPSRDLIERHLAAVRHVKWFDENANNTSLRALVRIIRDIRHRFVGLKGLNPWALLLLAHHALNSNKSASGGTDSGGLAPVFRRCLQLLAGGIFLPGAAGIPDPCARLISDSGAPYCASVHDAMTYEEMDQLTFTAQTLLRVNSHGGCRHILGLEGDQTHIATDMSIFSSIVVTASEAAYDQEEQMQWQQEDEQNFLAAKESEMDQSGEQQKDEQKDGAAKMDDDKAGEEQPKDLEQEVEAFMAMISDRGSSTGTADLMSAGDKSAVVVKSESSKV